MSIATGILYKYYAPCPDSTRRIVPTLLIDNATEITTRIKLKENTKTVDTDTGGLWYEEALPCETILYGLALATPVKASGMTDQGVFDELTTLMNKAVQLGGKATVGRGMCRVHMVQGGA
jgi:CRISPR-associated protein Cmr4